MPGLSLEARYALVRECERRALESPRVPGTRRLALTPSDARVLRALCFDFHNGRTGRTDPGYRAIARRAAVALGTVGAAIRRLAAAGFLAFERRLLRVAGRVLRWTNAYIIAAAPPRSAFGAEPMKEEKKEAQGRSVVAQLAYLAKWAAEWRPPEFKAHHHDPG
jgi:hypothetical protein